MATRLHPHPAEQNSGQIFDQRSHQAPRRQGQSFNARSPVRSSGSGGQQSHSFVRWRTIGLPESAVVGIVGHRFGVSRRNPAAHHCSSVVAIPAPNPAHVHGQTASQEQRRGRHRQPQMEASVTDQLGSRESSTAQQHCQPHRTLQIRTGVPQDVHQRGRMFYEGRYFAQHPQTVPSNRAVTQNKKIDNKQRKILVQSLSSLPFQHSYFTYKYAHTRKLTKIETVIRQQQQQHQQLFVRFVKIGYPIFFFWLKSRSLPALFLNLTNSNWWWLLLLLLLFSNHIYIYI